MTVAVATLTHLGIGQTVFAAAESILGKPALATRHFSFSPGDNADTLAEQVVAAIPEIDEGDGILVLADLYGSTPCNIARRLAPTTDIRVVSGLNLPMVLRVFTYARLDLAQLVERAADGARVGVIDCGPAD